MIGVAVGSQSLEIVTLVVKKQEEVTEPAQAEIEYKAEIESVGYDAAGLEAICAVVAASGEHSVLLSGNRRWAATLADALQAKGLDVRYVGRKGGKGKVPTFLKGVLASNSRGRPFFAKPKSSAGEVVENTDHPWLVKAHEYGRINDDIRRFKHRLLDCLRRIFPELLKLKEKLWGKKVIALLAKCSWESFEQFGFPWNDSLGVYVPSAERAKAEQSLKGLLFDLKAAENLKAELKEEVAALVGDHPAVVAYNKSFSAMLLMLLIGWNDWGKGRRKFRSKLVAYCGLDPSCFDSKGHPRISRRRSGIRTVLYHLRKTGRGKEVVAEATPRAQTLTKTGKLRLVKQLCQILTDFWRQFPEASPQLDQSFTHQTNELEPSLTVGEAVATAAEPVIESEEVFELGRYC